MSALVVSLREKARFSWGRAVIGAVALLLLIPNSSILEHRAVIAVFLVALVTGQARQFARAWLPVLLAAGGFVFLRQFAALSPLPHQGAAVAALESAAFGGTTPTAFLQALLYTPGQQGALDYLAMGVHASYFFGFVVVGLGAWLFAREQFRPYPALLALTFALGLIGYFLLPTEPPWLATRGGYGPPVHRIIAETAAHTRLASGVTALTGVSGDEQALGDPNPSAAMPSVHTAVTLALAIFLWRIRRGWGVLGAAYALAMAFSLVYLGEHYVADVVAGAACAVLAAWLALRGERP